jgi:hypothetical protein
MNQLYENNFESSVGIYWLFTSRWRIADEYQEIENYNWKFNINIDLKRIFRKEYEWKAELD